MPGHAPQRWNSARLFRGRVRVRQAFGGHPRIAYAAREWPTRLGLVAIGLGIAVLPEVVAASVPAGVRVVQVDDPAWLGRAVVAVTVRDRSPEVTATVGALRNEAAQLRAAP
ncbi:LysR substrate-binding domain-containing protein [Streptomyces sp. NRRL S-646]|uniref:LysR substrate-binding domain-containing protein n=1 Tax=Streptomyces sp. NRRL S-646 TaxID=1463917 RepID=UPI0022772A40|nr:LysR substrate-binding domain-containing protein [Streptomyces sp. NRRL S-646]